MARTRDVAWENYRRARRSVNERLVKAEKEGRLAEELRTIEREAARWWAAQSASAKPRRKAK